MGRAKRRTAGVALISSDTGNKLQRPVNGCSEQGTLGALPLGPTADCGEFCEAAGAVTQRLKI